MIKLGIHGSDILGTEIDLGTSFEKPVEEFKPFLYDDEFFLSALGGFFFEELFLEFLDSCLVRFEEVLISFT